MAPAMQGLGIGGQLLDAFCQLSASDPRSAGVYLETANPAHVRFCERAGFAVTGQTAPWRLTPTGDGGSDLVCAFER